MNLPRIYLLILRSIAKRCVSKDEATDGPHGSPGDAQHRPETREEREPRALAGVGWSGIASIHAVVSATHIALIS